MLLILMKKIKKNVKNYKENLQVQCEGDIWNI